jgi:hypothetical protein
MSIPPGGHLPEGYTFTGRDENDGAERVFAGFAGIQVKSLVLTLSNHETITIHPVQPEPALQNRFTWLRDMRYFVQFYPDGHHVRLVTAYNFKGRRVARVGGLEGDFSAFCHPLSPNCLGEQT